VATDKTTEILIDGLKQALAEPGEQRLCRSGKLAGLFPSRAGAGGDAAMRALREGLLELTRTEVRGKSTIEWVRITPRGVNFLHDHESPVRALRELQALLQVTRNGLPAWLGQLQDQVRALEVRLAEDVERLGRQIDALTVRVDEALRRAAAAEPQLSGRLAQAFPWAVDVLNYLDRRKASRAGEPCSLPELLEAVRENHRDLSVAGFHEGLRRVHDHHALELIPFEESASQIPAPEYALPDGARVLYYATR
jgi:hypothetical protein